MARTRRTRPELSESWDPVDDLDADASYSDESPEEEEIQVRTRRRKNSIDDSPRETPRTRTARVAAEPDLIMPLSPNASVANGNRSKTPRFRLNERSMTSDAGHIDAGMRRARDNTPRMRLNDRSMTSDAGQFVRKRAVRQNVTFDEDEPLKKRRDANHNLLWTTIFQPILAYCTEIIALVLHYAKPIIAYGLFAYLIIASIIFFSNFLTTTINNALSPICRVPGVVQLINPPFCESYIAAEKLKGPAEFEKLVQVESAFNEVLASSSNTVDLPLAMKRSESGIRDLRIVVTHSTIPSKNELLFEFQGFIETARLASDQLSRFNSRIGQAVDRILSTNRWTLSVIDGIKRDNENSGSISRFVTEALNIFAPFQPIPLSHDALLEQYLKHTSTVEGHVQKLIDEAHASLTILERLESHVNAIYDIAKRDDLKITESKDKLLSSLYVRLGGKRGTMEKLNRELELLDNIVFYRRVALGHVEATLTKLQAMRADLEGLRERVAAPEVTGTDAVPLEMHIATIELGIERLQEHRNGNKKAEDDSLQRVFNAAEISDREFVGVGGSAKREIDGREL